MSQRVYDYITGRGRNEIYITCEHWKSPVKQKVKGGLKSGMSIADSKEKKNVDFEKAPKIGSQLQNQTIELYTTHVTKELIAKMQPNLLLSKNMTQPIDELGNYQSIYTVKKRMDSCPEYIRNYILMLNPFETVPRKIKAISRAYFKLWELLAYFQDHNLVPLQQEKFVYAALAEAPGGFVQAVDDYRHMYAKVDHRDDVYYGISLKDDYEPQWTIKFPELMKRFKLSYGDPDINDGNLLNPRNIIAYAKQFKNNKADLVTADGGFLVETEMGTYKEQLHLPLFYAEIIAAFCVQKKGGCFVLKIYDIFTIPTTQLIFLLSIYYDSVFITKPLTSRPANSEKYVVATGFRGISKEDVGKYLDLLDQIYTHKTFYIKHKRDTEYISSFFDILVPTSINKCVKKYNDKLNPYEVKLLNRSISLLNQYGKFIPKAVRSKFTSFQHYKAKKWYQFFRL